MTKTQFTCYVLYIRELEAAKEADLATNGRSLMSEVLAPVVKRRVPSRKRRNTVHKMRTSRKSLTMQPNESKVSRKERHTIGSKQNSPNAADQETKVTTGGAHRDLRSIAARPSSQRRKHRANSWGHDAEFDADANASASAHAAAAVAAAAAVCGHRAKAVSRADHRQQGAEDSLPTIAPRGSNAELGAGASALASSSSELMRRASSTSVQRALQDARVAVAAANNPEAQLKWKEGKALAGAAFADVPIRARSQLGHEGRKLRRKETKSERENRIKITLP